MAMLISALIVQIASQFARDELNVRVGSIASFRSWANYFRSSPGNGHRQGRSPCLKSAMSGTRAMQQKELLFNDLVRKTHVRKIRARVPWRS